MLSSGATATLRFPPNLAPSAGPLSPSPSDGFPPPATVVIIPLGSSVAVSYVEGTVGSYGYALWKGNLRSIGWTTIAEGSFNLLAGDTGACQGDDDPILLILVPGYPAYAVVSRVRDVKAAVRPHGYRPGFPEW
jgi:hypothetical protein